MIWFVPLEPCILQEPTGGKRIIFVITNTFVVDTPSIGVAEILHQAVFHIDNEVVFHGVCFFCHSIGPVVGQDLLGVACAVPSHR